MNERLKQVRIRLIINQPFFGTLALRLKFLPTKTEETLATDGQSILYNEDYIKTLTDDELVGVIAHEVMHCALQHHLRQGDRDPKKWNIACDYAVNDILLKNNLILPTGALKEPAYEGWSAEKIYECLPETPESDLDPNICGLVKKPNIGSDELETQKQHWTSAVIQAEKLSQGSGQDSVGIDRLIEELKNSELDWRQLLWDSVTCYDKSDYDWTRPNGRFLSQNIYLPRLHSPKMGEIAVICDTSSSISNRMINQINAELTEIARSLEPSLITVIHCNTRVTSVELFEEPGPEIKIAPVGYGGTYLVPAFEWLIENDHSPDVIIVFTDLKFRHYPTIPDQPVIWVTPNKRIADFGETIELTL